MNGLNNYERMVNSSDLIAEVLSFLKDIQDSKKFDQIKDKIISINSLSEAEKNKLAETREYVRIHSSKLEEIQNINNDIKQKKIDISAEYADLARAKTVADEQASSKRADNQAILDAAQKLQEDAIERHKQADSREENLRQAQATFDENSRQAAKEKEDIERQRKALNDLSDSLNSLKNQTQEKLDALKRFNF